MMSTYNPKYYDPVKAHEYYMRTRQLKGYANRYGGHRETNTPSKEYYKEARSYNEAASSRIRSNNETLKKTLNDLNSQKKELSYNTKLAINGLNQQIKAIRQEYKLLDKNSKKSRKDEYNKRIEQVRAQITKMREDLAAKKEHLTNLAKTERTNNSATNREEQAYMKGGSTASLNDEGLKKAEELKKKIEDESKEALKKANKQIDNEMLSDVRKMYDEVKAARKNGIGIKRSKVFSKINKFRKRSTSVKKKILTENRQNSYVKYKRGLDDLRKKYYKR